MESSHLAMTNNKKKKGPNDAADGTGENQQNTQGDSCCPALEQGLVLTQLVVTVDASLTGWGSTIPVCTGNLALAGVNAAHLEIGVICLTFLHWTPLQHDHPVRVSIKTMPGLWPTYHQGSIRKSLLH